jgi:hypothetical protein
LVAIASPVGCQDATHRSAPNVQATGDLSFAGASTVELPDLVGVKGCRYWATQALAVLTGVRQAGTDALAQNLPFEFGKHGQQARHGSTGGCGQIQGFGQ